MARPQVQRTRWNLGNGLKALPSGPFSHFAGQEKNARDMPKFVVLWSALIAANATFAFPDSVFATPEENIVIATLLKGGWQIAGYTSTLDSRSAFILFRHPEAPYLVQCRASYDVTRTPPVTSNCYKLQ
jgi:hypothetical protein